MAGGTHHLESTFGHRQLPPLDPCELDDELAELLGVAAQSSSLVLVDAVVVDADAVVVVGDSIVVTVVSAVVFAVVVVGDSIVVTVVSAVVSAVVDCVRLLTVAVLLVESAAVSTPAPSSAKAAVSPANPVTAAATDARRALRAGCRRGR
ncbi:MAG TPA: hypothetical protein PKA24_16705, partial [Microthrixaceae bacterium]|nr:hypothetical protein [Microthrixaceae bacterium]